MNNLSPKKIYTDRLGPTLLKAKKANLLKVWEEYVVPQIQKGKLEVPEKFDFTAYLKTIDTNIRFSHK